MIIFRMIISALIALAITIYFFYVFVVSNPCERLSRATKPIDLGANLVAEVVQPWTTPNAVASIENWSARTRLRSAMLLRVQFYSKSEQPIICDWDIYADQMYSTPSLENGDVEQESYQGEAVGNQQSNHQGGRK